MRRRAFALITAVAAARLALLPLTDITPQEAYYWNFSRHPALGYFDHPPVMPWTIWLFTGIFGDNRFGIRFGAWAYGVGALLFLWLLSKRLWGEREAFFVALAASVVPLFTTAGTIFTPDPPLVFFWLGAVFWLLLALQENRLLYWSLAGVFSGLAMLSKYTAAFWFLGAALILLSSRRWRRLLFTPGPYVLLALAAVAFLPEVIWNATHGWASFAYQSTRRAHEIRSIRLDYFLGYVGSQFFALSPVFYVAAWREGILKLRRWISGGELPASAIVAAFAMPMMIFFTALATLYWVKLNWLIPAYFLPVASFVSESVRRRRRWYVWGTVVAAAVTFVVVFATVAPFVPISGELASTLGWKELAENVAKTLQQMPPGSFVFGCEYKVPSELAFHLPGKPETVGPHVVGLRGQQYTYWSSPDTLSGRDAICVVDPRWGFSVKRAQEILPHYFDSVAAPETLVAKRAGKAVTTFFIFRCFGYSPKRK